MVRQCGKEHPLQTVPFNTATVLEASDIGLQALGAGHHEHIQEGVSTQPPCTLWKDGLMFIEDIAANALQQVPVLIRDFITLFVTERNY